MGGQKFHSRLIVRNTCVPPHLKDPSRAHTILTIFNHFLSHIYTLCFPIRMPLSLGRDKRGTTPNGSMG